VASKGYKSAGYCHYQSLFSVLSNLLGWRLRSHW